RAWPEQRTLIWQSLVLVTLAGTVGYFVAPLVILLLAGQAFLPAVPLFRILLLGLVGMTLSAVMGSQWVGRGLFLQASLMTFAVGVLNVGANYSLMPLYGTVGAAWVSVCIYMIAVVGN